MNDTPTPGRPYVIRGGAVMSMDPAVGDHETADVLVDGEFIEELYDISLKFRGSSNQRLIDLAKTRETGGVVLWDK